MSDSPLRPRFIIKKNRIRQNDLLAEAHDFSPDRVIYVEIDDEITGVFDAIKRTSGKRIALVVPHRAHVIGSIINLKILKKKVDESGKEIVLVTSDNAGLALAEKAGIACVPKLFEKKKAEIKEKIPVHFPGERPVRTGGKKISLAEVIRNDGKSKLQAILDRVKTYAKKKKQQSDGMRFVFIAPNKQALFTLVLVGILLMVTVAYIALPGATIYLTPRSSILDPSFNVTFLDYERNRTLLDNSSTANAIVLASFPLIPPPFTKKIMHPATGKTFQGQNARGTIIVINEGNAPWDLSARTRFQTSDGIVFRTPVALRIPPSHGENPGSLDVSVVADEFDSNGQPIGSEGNIGPSDFFLPGLKSEENRKKLYAKSTAPMTGGVTVIVHSVSENDIAAAKEEIKREIIKEAKDDLKRYLDEQNLVKKQNLSLLSNQNLITVSEPAINIPADIVGKTLEQFEVSASYNLRGIAFGKEALITALQERVAGRVDPDKKLVKIDGQDVSYKFLDEDKVAGKVRVTATMRALQMYSLDPEDENGKRFLKKITDHVLGMRVKDAEEYLEQQVDEIARVDIKLWPVWAPTIPNIAKNIKFEIRTEE